MNNSYIFKDTNLYIFHFSICMPLDALWKELALWRILYCWEREGEREEEENQQQGGWAQLQ